MSGYYLHYQNDAITIRWSATCGQYKTLTQANTALRLARLEQAEYLQTAFTYHGLLA